MIRQEEHTEASLRADEQALSEEEARLSAEWARLQGAAGELLGRLQHARAGAAQVQQNGLHDPDFAALQRRLSQARLEAPDVSAHRQAALQARAEAVQARRQAAQAQSQALHGHAADLSRLSSQLAADEAALSAYEARSREAPPPPPPPEILDEDVPPPPPPPPVSRPQGRRALPRVRMQAAVDLHSDTNFFTGFSTNLSEGGLFVATVNALPLGTGVELEFTLAGKRLKVPGVVRWIRLVNDRTPEIFPGMGIRFEGLDPETSGLISRFVQEREPIFFPD
jgi:uncharacterized protein (TIGR02266 family)